MKYWFWEIWKYRKGKVAFCIIAIFFLIALFADFIANDRPLICNINGETHFPVGHEYLENLGWAKKYDFAKNTEWSDMNYKWAVFPIIAHSPKTSNMSGGTYLPPLSKPEKQSMHWLGTDQLGRDLASGLCHGSRYALAIGIFAAFLATLIALLIGVFAGYFGDDRLEVNVLQLILNVILGLLLVFYLFYHGWWFALILTIILLLSNSNKANRLLRNMVKKRVNLKVDLIVMRIVEVIDAIPAIFYLLVMMALLDNPTMWTIILAIGALTWITKARLVRGEVLKIRNASFVELARSYGEKDRNIILRHILPNSIQPLIIAVAFSVSSAILLEASLSFLGLGLGLEEVTWGSQMSEARRNFSAWWLAVFPGLAIFLIIWAFNLLGETINRIMSPKR